jgi:hypothetical protein
MVSRTVSWLAAVSLAAFLLCSAAHAQQSLKNDEISIDGVFEFSSTVSGNGITDKTSKSGGGEANFRHSYHWWLGYEGGYTYTRQTDFYTGQLFGRQYNLHDFSGDYYVHGARAFGIQPFAVGGVDALIFSPSLNGGQNVSWHAQPGLNFGAGIDVPLLTGHFGLRAEYRGVYYKAPDFGQAILATNAWRITSEPMAGVYVRF